MKIDDRDKIDDLFRSKLYDFESDALPDDIWEKIEGRLKTQRYTLSPSPSRWRWWAAAAVLLLIIGNAVYFLQKEPLNPLVVEQIEQKTEELKSVIREKENVIPPETNATPAIAEVRKKKNETKTVLKARQTKVIATNAVEENVTSSIPLQTEEQITVETDKDTTTESVEEVKKAIEPSPDQSTMPELTSTESKAKTKRWSFGMGAGSVAVGSSDAANIYAFRNTSIENVQLDFLNSINENYIEEAPKTDIKHHQPISIGFSVSYMLAPKWHLMAGLNYSYLSSDWITNGNYYTTTDQRLHFVGIPISLAYKIAEWNSFLWYANAGFMPEINVAGNVKEVYYVDMQKLKESKTNVRMKEWYWSVNAGTGVSYPIFRFLNVFAEVGAGYYFDNGSKIETIHSDKPFNVNFNFGLRLGF